MRITCPSCAAAYEVPESLIAGGQTVRCARCCANWTPIAAAAPPRLAEVAVRARVAVDVDTVRRPEPPPAHAAPGNPPPPMAAIDRLMAAAAPIPSDRGVRAGWLVSLALLAAAVLGAYFWRAEIMRAWPPSERLYATLGVAAPAR